MVDHVTKVQGAADLAVSLTTINNWIAKRLLPEPTRFSPVYVAWTREAYTEAANRIKQQPWYKRLQRRAGDEIRDALNGK